MLIVHQTQALFLRLLSGQAGHVVEFFYQRTTSACLFGNIRP